EGEGEIGGRVADDGNGAFADGLRPEFMHLLRRDDRHAPSKGPVVDVLLYRRADPDLHSTVRINESLLDRVKEYRAVRIGLPEIFGPSVDMRVKMDQRERRPPLACERAQQRQRNGMITAERAKVLIPGRLLLHKRKPLSN